jgi:uncharacterized membrane protein
MQPSPSLDAKGFFQSLFDFSFSSLITTRIIRIVYIVITVVYSLVAVVFLIAGLASGTGSGIAFAIIFVPIGYLLYLVFTRIWLELIIIVFRIGEDIRAIRTSGGGMGQAGSNPPGGWQPPSAPGPQGR